MLIEQTVRVQLMEAVKVVDGAHRAEVVWLAGDAYAAKVRRQAGRAKGRTGTVIQAPNCL